MNLYDNYGNMNYIILNNKRYFAVTYHSVSDCFLRLFSEEFLNNVFDVSQFNDIADIDEEMEEIIRKIEENKYDDRIISLNVYDFIMY